MPTVLRAQQLQGKRYLSEHSEETVHAFDYAFEPRRIYRLDGPEDGGKRLLWRLLTLLERPAGGQLMLGEAATARLSDAHLAELRNREVGYVFPTPYLLPGFTLVENVAMPLFKVLQLDPDEAKEITEEVLALTGLIDAAEETLDGLTALQQQVAALARAVIHRPSLLGIDSLGKNLAPADAALFSDTCQRLVTHFDLIAVTTVAPGKGMIFANVVLEVQNGTVEEVIRAPWIE
jgi:putative ABC transport system ATP-binding protein